MKFHSLPLRPWAALVALGLALTGPAQGEELRQSIDQTGTAINRQLGDWLGVGPQNATPRKPSTRAKKPAASAAAMPLPPRRPIEAKEQAAAAPDVEAAPASLPAPEIAAPQVVPPPAADRQAAAPSPAPVAPRPEPRPATETAARAPAPEKPVATAPAATGPVPPQAAASAPAIAAPPATRTVPLPPPAPERLAALPPAAVQPSTEMAAEAKEPVPTVCPELSNEDIGVFTTVTVTATKSACTVDRGVSLSAVRMKDGRLVTLEPAAVLRCEMAASVANWLRDEVEPAVATLGAPLDKVLVAASQQCRPRNRVAGAKISEHGRGNALDTRGYVLTDGRRFVIGAPRAGSGETAMPVAFQERLKTSACAGFTTILGPGSDGFHEEHLHVDRAERRSGAVLCRWATGPAVARVPKPTAKPPQTPAAAETPEAAEDAPEDAPAPDTAASGGDSGR
ncbi:extensin family protein [Starkeya koreensis]|uniref:Extensin family protein n=1 Tax=Ancylobacter koreensis TaxID=266121 RepID=A0ABT0DJL3_9HYPH|nr:extensin family protein [Ancylobacter koreensis]MCK0207472.1 extensin family protein [Ancylobacter koreensis]